MLNHIEIQGKIFKNPWSFGQETRFIIDHQRGFGGESDKFICAVDGDRRRLLDGADEGRTVIVTGRLRSKLTANGGSCEIVCETIDFVDGGGKDG